MVFPSRIYYVDLLTYCKIVFMLLLYFHNILTYHYITLIAVLFGPDRVRMHVKLVGKNRVSVLCSTHLILYTVYASNSKASTCIIVNCLCHVPMYR